MSREEEIRKGLYDLTIVGDRKQVEALTNEGVSLNMEPTDMLFNALIPSLQEVGRRFETGEYFLYPKCWCRRKRCKGRWRFCARCSWRQAPSRLRPC